MHDERGAYYYPNPAQKSTRMYVRRIGGVLHFRLYNSQVPEIWERHGWIAKDVVRQAATLYSGDKDPTALYDEVVAEQVLLQAENERDKA